MHMLLAVDSSFFLRASECFIREFKLRQFYQIERNFYVFVFSGNSFKTHSEDNVVLSVCNMFLWLLSDDGGHA